MELLKYVQEIEEAKTAIETSIDYGLNPNNILDGVTIFGTEGGVVGTVQNINYTPSFDDRVTLSSGMSLDFDTTTALRIAPSLTEEMLQEIQYTIREAIRNEFSNLRVSRDDTVTYSVRPTEPMEYITTRIDLSPPTEDDG